MPSRISPEQLLSVVSCVTCRIMGAYPGWGWIFVYIPFAFVSFCAYVMYPSSGSRASVGACLFTFTFTLFGYSMGDWKNSFEESGPYKWGWIFCQAFLFAFIQGLTTLFSDDRRKWIIGKFPWVQEPKISSPIEDELRKKLIEAENDRDIYKAKSEKLTQPSVDMVRSAAEVSEVPSARPAGQEG